MTLSPRQIPWKDRLPYLLLFLFLGVQLLGLTRIHGDWWFEDDAYQRHFILHCPEPSAYFLDREKNYPFNMGRSFTPLLAFTLFLDTLVSPKSPTPAYLHTMLSLALTTLLFFALLRRFLDSYSAVFVTAIWLFLPSTIAVTEFLATRHYLEGFMFSLAALLLATALPSTSKPGQWFVLMAVAILYYLAALAKEVYVTFTFFALIALFSSRKRFGAMALIFATGLAYSIHRLWFLQGLSRDSFPLHTTFFKYFASMPFTFSGNNGGYLLAILLGLLLILAVFKKKCTGQQLLMLAGAVAVLLFSIFPVYHNLHGKQQELGTWYRLVFLANSFWLAMGGWLCRGLLPRNLSIGVALLAVAIVLPGGLQTARNWDHMKTAYREEAVFYLENPDKLLYTELPAPWFITNIHDLYEGDTLPHVIDRRGIMDRGVVQRLLEDSDHIWRYTPEGYQPDPELHPFLFQKNLQMPNAFSPARNLIPK